MRPSDNTSGFIPPSTVEVSTEFTDTTVLDTKGFNLLIRAKRYGRWWMLKGLKEEYRNQTIYRLLLNKEYNLMAQLSSPNVVTVNSIEEVSGFGLCIVMEWIDGVKLSTWLEDGNRNLKQRRRVAQQIIDGLAYIHSRQIVHRDLKPSNIMITSNGEMVKLIDFGLGDADSYAILKQPAGTDGYVSTEQQSRGKPDIRNDIYSLGKVLACLRLGLFTKPVIKRCLCTINKRYQCAEDVNNALRKSYRIHYYASMAGLILILSASIITFKAGLHTETNKPETIAQSEKSESGKQKEKKDFNQDAMKNDSDIIFRTEAKKSDELPQKASKNTSQITENINDPNYRQKRMIEWTKKNIDNAWLKRNLRTGETLSFSKKEHEIANDAIMYFLPSLTAHMNTISDRINKRIDTLTIVSYIEPYIKKELKTAAAITDDYVFSYMAKTSPQLCTLIENTLNRYIHDFYYRKWMERIKEKNLPQTP